MTLFQSDNKCVLHMLLYKLTCLTRKEGRLFLLLNVKSAMRALGQWSFLPGFNPKP